jgi:hypothetical protein
MSSKRDEASSTREEARWRELPEIAAASPSVAGARPPPLPRAQAAAAEAAAAEAAAAVEAEAGSLVIQYIIQTASPEDAEQLAAAFENAERNRIVEEVLSGLKDSLPVSSGLLLSVRAHGRPVVSARTPASVVGAITLLGAAPGIRARFLGEEQDEADDHLFCSSSDLESVIAAAVCRAVSDEDEDDPATASVSVSVDVLDCISSRLVARRNHLSLNFRFGSYHPFHTPLRQAFDADDLNIITRPMLDFMTGDLKALYDDYGLENGSPHWCLFCEATRGDRGRFWPDVRDKVPRRTLESIDDNYLEWCAKGSKAGAPVLGVQAPRMADTPLERVAPAPLHIFALGPPVDLYKELRRRAARRDGFDDVVIAALEIVAACEESVTSLNEAEALLDAEVKKLKSEIKVLKEKEEVERDKMPSDCQSSTISWPTAESRGSTRSQFNALTRSINLRVNTQNEVKSLLAEKAVVAKDITKAGEELQEAESRVEEGERPMTDGIHRALKKVGIDTTKHFGGDSFAGGAAQLFLSERDEFFAEVLSNLPGDAEAASIRDMFLPLMALLEELAHEGRRAKVSQR